VWLSLENYGISKVHRYRSWPLSKDTGEEVRVSASHKCNYASGLGWFECVEIDCGLSRRSLGRLSENQSERFTDVGDARIYRVEYFDINDDGAELDWCITCGSFGFVRGCRSILLAGVTLGFG
jgi:hypothetical protein